MTPDLAQRDEARAHLFPIHCTLCNRVIAHSQFHVIEPMLCCSCTSCHPQPRYGGRLGAASLLVFALRQENLFLAHNLCAAALSWKQVADNAAKWTGTAAPVRDLSHLQIKF